MVITGSDEVAEGYTFTSSEGGAMGIMAAIESALEHAYMTFDDNRSRFQYYDGPDYKVTIKVEKL